MMIAMRNIAWAFGSLLALAAPAAGAVAQPANDPPWSAATSAELRFIYQRQDVSTLYQGKGDAVVASPDGKYFFFSSRSGNIKCNCNVHSLNIYRTDDVIRAIVDRRTQPPAPYRIVEMEHELATIRAAKWAPNSREIEFIGNLDPKNLKDLKSAPYVFDVEADDLWRAVGNVSGNASLDARLNKSFIYTDVSTVADQSLAGDMVVLDDTNINQLISGKSSHTDVSTYVSYKGSKPIKLSSITSFSPSWLSPTEDWAIMVRRPQTLPPGWDHYNTHGRAIRHAGQFVLVGMKTGGESPLTGTPSGRVLPFISDTPEQAFWSSDGRQVAIFNTTVPAAPGPKGGDPDMAYLVAADIQTGRQEVLAPLRDFDGATATGARWIESGSCFAVDYYKSGQYAYSTEVSYVGNKWTLTGEKLSMKPDGQAGIASLPKGFSVELRESATQPQQVVATFNGRSIPLTRPDPALMDVWTAPMKEVEWTSASGEKYKAGLILPRNPPPHGAKLPLVIQLAKYFPDKFNPDGGGPTGFAAQQLAAQGIAVLVLDIAGTGKLWDEAHSNRSKMISTLVGGVEDSAISLADKYNLDLNRVGLIGFSFTGYIVRYLVTHSQKLKPAAAVIADSYNLSFPFVLNFVARDMSLARAPEDYYGGPFYDNKRAWLDKEVDFNVDKVKTPILFADNDTEMLTKIDTIGAFKMANRPFEYVFFPNAAHQLTRPAQRIKSINLVVDWMSFWLQGREIEAEAKSVQYGRWHALRKMVDSQSREPERTATLAQPDHGQANDRQKMVAEVTASLSAMGIVLKIDDPNKLNTLAYQKLYGERDADLAIRLMTWNLALFPSYAGELSDSLGEAYLQKGDAAQALSYYERALRESSHVSEYAERIVEMLKSHPEDLSKFQTIMKDIGMKRISTSRSINLGSRRELR